LRGTTLLASAKNGSRLMCLEEARRCNGRPARPGLLESFSRRLRGDVQPNN